MQEVSIQILSGQNALAQIADADLRHQWTTLHGACTWATSMQSLPFVESWYECYLPRYDPILVTEHNADNKLIGLLPLAIERDSSRLVVAGDNLCEYGTWIAATDNGNQFITKALDALNEKYPNSVLQFLFLAADTPLEWLDDNKYWKRKCALRKVSRPLLLLDDSARLQATLNKRGNRTKLNQMGRKGAIELVQLTEPDELNAVFDEVHTLGDLRLSAIHRVPSSFDPFKKKFYFELLKKKLLHATLLKAGEKIASAHFDLHNRDQVLLGLTAFSPIFNKYSPNKFHITMLCLELIKQGVKTYDLTPGGGYKDNHANSQDEVHVLTIYFNQKAHRNFTIKRQLIGVVKKGFEIAKVDQQGLVNPLYELRHKLKFASAGSIIRKLSTKVRKSSEKKREMRIYTFPVEKIQTIQNPNLMNRDCITDLLKYEPSESWQPSPSAFHRLVIERLSEGVHVYTKVEADKLGHYGWLIERQEKSFITEVNQYYTMQPDSAVLFDFFTHPKARKKGLYQAAMRQMLHDASRIPNTRQVYISVLADNIASRHAIEKIGFEYECSLYG